MSSLASISLSGLRAAQTAMSASAFNIANLDTAGFRRQQVQQFAVEPAGVTAIVDQASAPGSDMAREVVGLLQAKNALLANVAVFKAADATAGAWLDLYG